jgi:Phage terminase, small subunit
MFYKRKKKKMIELKLSELKEEYSNKLGYELHYYDELYTHMDIFKLKERQKLSKIANSLMSELDSEKLKLSRKTAIEIELKNLSKKIDITNLNNYTDEIKILEEFYEKCKKVSNQ